MKLNETPVRTSRNFNINNIKLENIEIPQQISSFENVEKIGENTITQDIMGCDLVYGLSNELTKQLEEHANQKLKLTIDSKDNKEIQIIFNFDSKNLQLKHKKKQREQ